MTGGCDIRQLLDELDSILAEMQMHQEKYRRWVECVHPENVDSARNLLDYLAFRSRDRTATQALLNRLGLSSLGRSEAAIRPQVVQVRTILEGLSGAGNTLARLAELDPAGEGRKRLRAKADALFGPNKHRRSSRVMVTLPSEAATDRGLVERLLNAGMDIARINCAHDDQGAWRAMAGNVRELNEGRAQRCLIACDLAGPKLRTGDMPAGPRTCKAKPPKNLRGEVERPVRVCFYPHRSKPPAVDAAIFIPLVCDGFHDLKALTKFKVKDARGKKRQGYLLEQAEDALLFALYATTFFESGQQLRLVGEKFVRKLVVAELPEQENFLTVGPGDRLRLVADGRMATPALKSEQGELLQPATVSCATEQVLGAVAIGHRVKIDDGKFSARVIDREPGALLTELEMAPLGGGKLKAEKGVNFPDTELPLSGFTDDDRRDLKTAVEIADIIDLSFVNEAEDVERLLAALEQEGAPDIGVVLKIETRKGADKLPELLLTALRRPRVGVMIARGDLGVEVGWREVAQLQEEILWFCTAAHIPTIWATQVLESLAKKGTPTRAEITDAAMAQRAECVMLNKGPFMPDAIKMLNSIIKAMDAQQEKKTALLPQMKVSPLTRL